VATIWVSTSGDDANSGADYANAKATLNGATGAISVASQGDTINIVNDGDHACVQQIDLKPIGFQGTSWSDPGLIIRGTDSSGNPAKATIKADTTNTFYIHIMDNIYALHAYYIQIEGLVFDYTALSSTSTSDMYPIFYYGNVGSQRVYDCEFLYTASVGSGVSITNTNNFVPFYFDGASYALSSPHTFEVTGCYFQASAYIRFEAIEYMTYDIHHNVIIFDAAAFGALPLAAVFPYSETSNMYRKFYHNTIYSVRYGSDVPSQIISDGSTSDTEFLSVHSNLFFVECGSSAVSPGLGGNLMQGTTGATAGLVGTFGYNGLYLGTNISAFWSAWTGPTPGISIYQFNPVYRSGVGTPSGQDIEGTDSLRKSAAAADVFAAPTSSYAWTRSGGSYSHTLPYDLRPINDPKVALDGTAPGALDFALTVPDPGNDAGLDPVADIDSRPFFRVVPKANLQSMVRIDRNKTIGHIDSRHYVTGWVYDEDVGRLFKVASGATENVNLSGVNKARIFVIETDTQVTLTVNTETESLDVTLDEMLILDDADVMSFKIVNGSSSTATIRFSAIQ